MLIPFAAGGGADTLARIISPKLSDALGQQWVIDNRGGAAGNLAAEIVARAAPDGYTVFMGFSTFPQGLGVDPVRNLVYVSHSGVALMRIIDGATDLEVGQINMSGVSTDAQPNPVTGRFYVTVYDKGLVRAMRYD